MTEIRTIRKNTREAREVFEFAEYARVFTLSENFIGRQLDAKYAAEALHRYSHAKLTTNSYGGHTVHVHGNLWYEVTPRVRIKI